MSETRTGHCTETTEKSGWTTFHVDVGEQYPLKLSTKLQPVIDSARLAGSNVAEWTFKEQESDRINENTGRPYINRYLEGVNPAGPPVAVGRTPDTAGGRQSHPPVTQGDKDRSITRMAVLKAASELYAGTGDVDGVFAAATRMETWVYRDIDPVPFMDEAESVQGGAAGGVPADDIPF
jgi:hypothetical protein